MRFEEMNLRSEIKRALGDMGYVDATEIQEKAIPNVMSKRDVIGESKTGTGKTASFALPIINGLDLENKKSVQALIMCPTRELSMQVADEIQKYLKYMKDVKILCVYGGQGIEKQIVPLRRGVSIVIGTPGRIMDHIKRKTIKLQDTKIVVLDEADEMLNMGFEEDIESILSSVNEERQTVLFSATMNKRIMNITKKYLKDPVHIKIKAKELTVNNITQNAVDIKTKMKDEATVRFIKLYNPTKTVVFCNTKKEVDSLLEFLKKQGYLVEGIHSDIRQEQRTRIMKRFKEGEVSILVATDVAARGLDVEGLELVINYNIPKEEEYYVHRIGRTGRNGKKGTAITYVVGREKNRLSSIEKYTNASIEYINVPTTSEIDAIKNKEFMEEIQQIIDSGDTVESSMFNKLCEKNDYDMTVIARALFTAFMKERTNKEETVELNRDMTMQTLFLNIGKMDNTKAKDVVGAIASNTSINGSDIGRISIMDKFTFVEVPKFYANEIIDSMQGRVVKGRHLDIELSDKKLK